MRHPIRKGLAKKPIKNLESYKRELEGRINPIASIFAWSRGLAHRAKVDKNSKLKKFCFLLEELEIIILEFKKILVDGN